jgi:hypothetical protein
MSHVSVATPPMKSIEEFDALAKHLPANPEGMQARYVGTCDGELRIVSVWDSAEAAATFFAEHVGPALAKLYGSETRTPKVDHITVARAYTRELVS